MSSFDSRLLTKGVVESRLPAAPYPPAPAGGLLRSSMSSSPHYAKRPTPGEAAAAAAIKEEKHPATEAASRKLKFVSIRTAPSNPELYCAINLTDEDVQVRSKFGPMLCEIGKISFEPALRSQGRLWQTERQTVSRGNTSLGPSTSSTCLSWSPTSMQVATGLSTGNLCIHTFPQDFEKPATQDQFSIGRNKRPATAVAWRPNQTNHIALGLYLGGSSMNQHHHQRKPRATDFGCLLWDITSTSGAPLLKVCHNASVACLEWLHTGGQTLAVGCQLRPLQLYDLRSTSSPPVSLQGADSTLGMCVDDHILATYGSASEPVKLWDLRNIEAPLGEIKVDQAPTTVAWSRPGILSIAVKNRILHYDTLSKPVLIDQTWAPLPVLDMDMVPNQERFLVVLEDKSIRDVSKHTMAPLAFSRRDGHVVHAFADQVWRAKAVPEDDISNVMKSRAGCRQDARYSMDAYANMEILASNHSLLHLWRWVARMESNHTTMLALASSMNLLEGGVKNFIALENADADEDASVLQAECLAMEIYDSQYRRAALAACGWSSTDDTGAMLRECERQGEYERAAALAVWHDNVGAAVELLDQGAKKAKNAGLLQLVSICIAGYNGANSTVWQQACSNLLHREDLQDGSSVAYLHALLRFLLASQHQDGIKSVLDDERLSLCDRVGFACRFLRRSELRAQLQQWIYQCQSIGNVEGLVLTGLTLDGIKILQSFVDRNGDVQTAALVTSRVIMPSEWVAERKICSEWLEVYRALLNSWQMWQSRAMFDVDRADLLRNSGQMARHTEPRGTITKNDSKQAEPDFVLSPTIPAQLDARCNYCSVSLSGSRKQEGITNQWLSRSKNVLSCCPRCRKPLPRCAICLLSLGCLNPYMELKRAGSKNRSANDLSSLANLPFAEWFTWCMRCKHGGHAHHLVGWFANHETCPVSGCDCNCQFDGINLMSREDPPPNTDLAILQRQSSLATSPVKKV